MKDKPAGGQEGKSSSAGFFMEKAFETNTERGV